MAIRVVVGTLGAGGRVAVNQVKTGAFIETAFRDVAIRTTGTAITNVPPPISGFASEGSHSEKKQCILAKLAAFFERFFAFSSEEGEKNSQATRTSAEDRAWNVRDRDKKDG